MKSKIIRIFMIVVIAAVVAACGLAAWFCLRTMYYVNDAQRKQDITQIGAEDPECLVLSMMQPEYFPAEDFTYYRGVSAADTSHTFKNLYDIRDFLESVSASPGSIYLILDPEKIASLYGYHASLYGRAYRSTLLEAIRSDTNVTYEILLTFPSLAYWQSLSDAKLEDVFSSYRDFVNLFAAEPNVQIYFPGAEEWLIANPGNYESDMVCNASVAGTILSFTFRGDEALKLTLENMEDKWSAIRSLISGTTTEPLLTEEPFDLTTDLSDVDIVFFGDSVIGNFNDSTSIPGVIAGFTGATTYNLGLGGASATSSNGKDGLNLGTMIKAFLQGNPSLPTENAQFTEELEKYLDDHSDGTEHETYFVISYGMNDYFAGYPIDTPLTEDMASCYTGALREAVSLLREACPESRILLMTPNFCSYYKNGSTPQSDVGGALADYADAVMQVAEESNVEAIDNYHLGIGAKNYDTYLNDGCHPNELGRYIIGRHIITEL